MDASIVATEGSWAESGQLAALCAYACWQYNDRRRWKQTKLYTFTGLAYVEKKTPAASTTRDISYFVEAY